MALSLTRRRVGDITVVTCSGRIVEGTEGAALGQLLSELIAINPHILLHLGEVDFIDSSGLGLLVRFLIRARNANGALKVCAVSPRIAEALKVTKLYKIFDPYETEADAIRGFYQRQDSTGGFIRPAEILCVDRSADVLAYVRELLRHSGYEVLASDNLPDALTLLTATRPKVVVIGSELRAARNTRTAETFNRLAEGCALVELPPQFGTRDAADAGSALLGQVRAVLGAADGAARV